MLILIFKKRSGVRCLKCHKDFEITPNGLTTNKMAAGILEKGLHLSDEEIALKNSIEDAIRQLEQLQNEAKSKHIDFESISYDHFSEIRRKIDLQREELKAKIDTIALKMIDQAYKKENIYKLKMREMRSQINEVDIFSYRQAVLSEFRKPDLIIDDIKRLKGEHELMIARFQTKLAELDAYNMEVKTHDFKANQEFLSDSFGALNLNSPKLISINILENYIEIRDLALNEHIGTLHGPNSYIECIAMIDNNKFATASFDNTIQIWDAQENSCIRTLIGHKFIITSLKSSPQGTIASGAIDGIKIWNIDSGQCLQTVEECKYFVDFVFLSNGNLVSCHSDKTIRTWDLAQNKCVRTFTLDFVTNCLLLLANGNLACGCDDYNIRILNIDSGLVINNLHGHSSSVLGMQSLPNGDLASCSCDHTIKIWNLDNDTCVRTLFGHQHKVNSIQISKNRFLVSCSEDGTIKEWDLNTGNCFNTIVAWANDFIVL